MFDKYADKKISDLTESELRVLHGLLDKKFETIPSLPTNARCKNPTCRYQWHKRSRRNDQISRKCPRCNSTDIEFLINKKWTKVEGLND